jgi:hypothetical protein
MFIGSKKGITMKRLTRSAFFALAAEGRHLNRRVELIVSGDVIGNIVGPEGEQRK